MSDFLNTNKPKRAKDVEARPAPLKQDGTKVEPWFVSDDKSDKKGINTSAKQVVKRSASVLFPVLGLSIIIISLALVLIYVVGIYE